MTLDFITRLARVSDVMIFDRRGKVKIPLKNPNKIMKMADIVLFHTVVLNVKSEVNQQEDLHLIQSCQISNKSNCIYFNSRSI